jgi:adenine-specific DNA-methyltransferase
MAQKTETTETPDMPEKLDLRSHDVAADKMQELLRLFPEIRTEGGKVDFERLKLALGEAVDVGRERYGLTWSGKADCFKTIQAPSLATLRPAVDESVHFDTSENLIVEGDNLEVLKLLQKSYLGKVKMIYIDPPYNTGNDFIYPDNYAESLQTYLEYTGQVDAQGKKFSTNTDTDGRFHSKWLNMMYPRLYLARNLLRDDGVIFASIGDQEVSNLKKLFDDVFGEENYINLICVKAKPSAGASGGGEDKRLKKNAEYLFVYARNRNAEAVIDLDQAFDETELMEHISSMEEEERSWKYTRVLTSVGNKRLVSTIQDGDGNDIKVFRHSNYQIQTISELATQDGSDGLSYLLHFERVFRDTNAQSSIRLRVMAELKLEDGLFSIDYVPRRGRNRGTLTTVYYKGPNKDQIAWLHDIARKSGEKVYVRGKTGTLWSDFNWNNVSKEGDMLFPNGKKPIAFIQRMLKIGCAVLGEDPRGPKSDLVLDFFAGSGTTAHAVFDLNRQDGGNRKFILVQLPEPTGRPDYATIADITKERVRRVIKKLDEEDAQAGKQLSLTDKSAPAPKQDRGFRVFKLAESNFKPWNADIPKDAKALTEQLELHIDHIRPGRGDADLLHEILLKTGYPPTTPVETIQLAGKTVYSAASGAFLICLERPLTLDLIRAMAERKPERAVCLDEGFAGNDQLKANAVQIFRGKGVVSFKTV